MKRKLLTTQEVADLLGITRQAVALKIKSGQIKAKKVGRSYVIDSDDLAEITGEILGERAVEEIKHVVKRTVKEYGETLKLLGDS